MGVTISLSLSHTHKKTSYPQTGKSSVCAPAGVKKIQVSMFLLFTFTFYCKNEIKNKVIEQQIAYFPPRMEDGTLIALVYLPTI